MWKSATKKVGLNQTSSTVMAMQPCDIQYIAIHPLLALMLIFYAYVNA